MAAKSLKKGLFLTFEGVEGCGKSTHSKLIFEYLKIKGYPVIHTREPGGTRLGEGVRKILLDSDGIYISDLAELFLFEACRSQIVKEAIKPALDKKKIVICDRFSDATFSYQGYGGKLPLKDIKILDKIATGGLVPDLTILLDIETQKGLKRACKKGRDRMESKELAYHRRVRSGYLKLAKNNPRRIKVINTEGDIKDVQDAIKQEVESVISKHKRAG